MRHTGQEASSPGRKGIDVVLVDLLTEVATDASQVRPSEIETANGDGHKGAAAVGLGAADSLDADACGCAGAGAGLKSLWTTLPFSNSWIADATKAWWEQVECVVL